MAKAEDEKGTFRKSMREMHNDETKAWKEKIEVFDRQFCEQIAEKGYELKDLEESVREVRKSVLSRRRAEEELGEGV